MASDTNVRTSLCGGPWRIFRVPNQDVYNKDWTASSDQILMARVVKNVDKIGLQQPRKNRKEREKRVRLAEHLNAEQPIQQWGSADKCSLYMCAKFCCSDVRDSDMVDD